MSQLTAGSPTLSQIAVTADFRQSITDDFTGGLPCIRPHALTAAQLEPLAKMIARQLAQEGDGVGWREPFGQLPAGER